MGEGKKNYGNGPKANGQPSKVDYYTSVDQVHKLKIF